jgi:hypothetical protein
MKTKESRVKKENKVRFTGGGALLMAMIGLIILSPLTASGQDHFDGDEAAEADEHYLGAVHTGPRRFGPGPEASIEFMTIVLDLSESQVEEIEPILDEHHEKMAKLRDKGVKRGRRGVKISRIHHCCCDRFDKTEMRAKMRRQKRKMEKSREEILEKVERNREKFEKKLAEVLDEDQMKKFRELRELRDSRREEMREKNKQRRGERT